MLSAPRPSGAGASPAIHQDASTERMAPASDPQSEPGTTRPVRELSMEEILASIRRIIADDPLRTPHDNNSRSPSTVGTRPLGISRTERQSPAYLPAGVSARWLNSIFPVIDGVDLWLTGQDLITLDTGIITHPLTNTTPRVAAAQTEELG